MKSKEGQDATLALVVLIVQLHGVGGEGNQCEVARKRTGRGLWEDKWGSEPPRKSQGGMEDRRGKLFRNERPSCGSHWVI